MPRFRSTREILTLIGASTYETLPNDYAQTFVCPVRADATTPLRCVFYQEFGPPEQRVVEPPSYVIDVDGVHGTVLRFARCTPAEAGAAPPLRPVPGAGDNPPSGGDEYLDRRDRLYLLAPIVWEGFVTHADPAIAPKASEFFSLLLSITPARVAPFMVGAAPAFFQWLHAVTGR